MTRLMRAARGKARERAKSSQIITTARPADNNNNSAGRSEFTCTPPPLPMFWICIRRVNEERSRNGCRSRSSRAGTGAKLTGPDYEISRGAPDGAESEFWDALAAERIWICFRAKGPVSGHSLYVSPDSSADIEIAAVRVGWYLCELDFGTNKISLFDICESRRHRYSAFLLAYSFGIWENSRMGDLI